MKKTYADYSKAIDSGVEAVVKQTTDKHTLPSAKDKARIGCLKGSLIAAYMENEKLKESIAKYKADLEQATKTIDEIKEVNNHIQ